MTSAIDKPVDVIVVGGGMAGLSAALAAAGRGARVTVLEADTVPGGSARWSSGRIWTLPDYASLRRTIPLGDHRLQRMLADQVAGALDWLAASVGHLAPQPSGKSGFGRSMTLGTVGDRTAYFQAFAQACVASGVRFLYGSRMTGLEPGTPAGFTVRAETDTGRFAIRASSVVIASGGYQGDIEMLSRHLGAEAALLMVRSNPQSRGDGVRAGLAMQGTLSRGTSAFYGKSMPIGAEVLAPSEFKTYTLDIARHTIAVNIEGRRFVDESGGTAGEAIPNAGIYQPASGAYFLIVDGTQAEMLSSDALRALAERVGRPASDLLLEAPSIEGLCERMAGTWGVDREGLDATMAEVRQAATSGQGQAMTPPRRVPPTALAAAPFQAVACRAAITIPFGGLAVDNSMAMVGLDGRPAAGLYAAGADAGGAYYGTYAGGLAWALTSGRRAGNSAAIGADFQASSKLSA